MPFQGKNLRDLAIDETRWLLARVWTDPLGLDPRHSAKVTREIADKLAKLAKSFESATTPRWWRRS